MVRTLDRRFIGRTWPAADCAVDRDRLRAFARAIGATDAVYLDVQAAQAAGHRDLLAPPTYVCCLEMIAGGAPFVQLDDLGIPREAVLHGEQDIRFCNGVICAGDRLMFTTRITDIRETRDGTFDLIVRDTSVTNQLDAVVVHLRQVLLVRRAS
jgi:hypothetical protein